MRASRDGRDDLDVALTLADLPAPYLATRRAAIDRFRAQNPDWTSIYASESKKQAVACVIAVALAVLVASRKPWSLIYLVTGFLALVLEHRGFDLTAIRGGTFAFVAKSALASLLATSVLFAWRRDLDDLVPLVAAGLFLALAQPIVFGAKMGFPLPGPHVLFFPSVQTTMLAVHALFALIVLLWLRPKNGRPVR
jgi:hypothetical protein